MSCCIENSDTPSVRKASFFFKEYKFTRSLIDFALIPDTNELSVEFIPSGRYFVKTSEFETSIRFHAKSKTSGTDIIKVDCMAIFEFGDILPFEELPEYFFTNSTAILYPYIRAFVSTLTLQSNYDAFVLPTLNVSSLGKELKDKTEVIE